MQAESTAQLTPVELRNGRLYKRDDLYRGLGGTNGAKLRACEHLIGEEVRHGAQAIVTAASVLSPQHAIVANVCHNLGVPSHHIVGATNDTAMARHPSVASALKAGATFHHIKCGYNASLQPAAAKMADGLPGAAVLHYGITTGPHASPAAVRRFVDVGARQVVNIPAEVTTLVVPFGSGNSAAGILAGLDRFDRLDMAVKLVGIGPSRLDWLVNRLAGAGARIPANVEHFDLHGTGFTRYSDKMPETQDGVTFHPTYEGKVIRYLDRLAPPWWTERDGTTCMWIIGGPMR